jgi:hypothetical protein
MVIQQIDVERIPVLETEDDAPVGSHRHRPEAFQVARQWMQPKAMDIHVFDLLSDIQEAENVLDLLAGD